MHFIPQPEKHSPRLKTHYVFDQWKIGSCVTVESYNETLLGAKHRVEKEKNLKHIS